MSNNLVKKNTQNQTGASTLVDAVEAHASATPAPHGEGIMVNLASGHRGTTRVPQVRTFGQCLDADDFAKREEIALGLEQQLEAFSNTQIAHFVERGKKRSRSEETDMYEQMAEGTGPYGPPLKKRSVQDLRAQMEREYALEVKTIRSKINSNKELTYKEQLRVRDHAECAKRGQFFDDGIFRTAEEWELYKNKY